jgi:Flp pilus assembly protein TadG
MGNPRRRRSDARGQALVEFSLVIMIFMTLIVSIIEFSFILTTKIGVTNAAQDAVQLASEMGNTADTDLWVLQLVEKDISLPLDKGKIYSVQIFSTDNYGSARNGADTYLRGGSTSNATNTITVPYSISGTKGYPESARCSTVAVGVCGGVDYIGVTITYKYTWVTPLPNLAGLGTSPPTFVQTSVSRLEPIQ